MKMKKENLIYLVMIVGFVAFLAVLIAKTNASQAVKVSESDPVIGSPSAPITIVMFTKHGCSASKNFFEDIYPRLDEQYIRPGKARLVFKYYQQLTENNTLQATYAALCANQQGKFWEYNRMLYENEAGWFAQLKNPGVAEVFNPVLLQYAQNLSIDTAAFSQCLKSNNFEQQIRKDFAYGQDLGVSQTPVFFINGLKIPGVPSWSNFEAVLKRFG